MAKVDVIMPQMGESIAEGTLTKWLKSVGDAIERDDDLFEISTDKVDADIPAPTSGVLAEILVQEGETVEVNTIVARIETEAGAVAAPGSVPDAAVPEPESSVAAAVTASGPYTAAPPAGSPPAPPEAPIVRPPAEPAAAPPAASPPAEPGAGDGPATREDRLRTRSTPLVRKIAAEHEIDIAHVSGTGLGGRVTRDDILAYLERQPAAVEVGSEVPATTIVSPAATQPATTAATTAATSAAAAHIEAKVAVEIAVAKAITPAIVTPAIVTIAAVPGSPGRSSRRRNSDRCCKNNSSKIFHDKSPKILRTNVVFNDKIYNISIC